MQTSDIEKKEGLFKYLGHSKGILSWLRGTSDADNPYMLDAINEIGGVLTVYGRKLQISSFKRLKQVTQSDHDERFSYQSGFQKIRKVKGEMRMVRVSECKYFVATGQFSQLEKLDSKIKEIKEFTLSEGQYSYLEWSPLNSAYIEKPSFLTLDDKGSLRLHYVKEKTEQVIESEKTEQIVEPGEVFRSATFSLGGKYIYAMNDKQELCKIDSQELKIVIKRKIEGLSNPEEVLSSHIKQLSPWIFVIGSMMKTDNEEALLKPYLHLVSGNISDLGEDLKIKAFEMPLFEAFDSKKPVIFRTMYLKGRQLLLFGHSGSNKVRVLNLAPDGSEKEIEGITLKNTLRGVIFMKEPQPIELKNEYQNKEQELSDGPKLVIMDSEGDIHHFRYFDPKSCAPTLSSFVRPQYIDQFVKSRGRLRGWLDRKERKKINRCKSRDSKIGITSTAEKKKRSKSQNPRKYSPLETKISSFEKQQTTKLLKESHQKISFGLFKSQKNPLFKATESPFLLVKKTEDKPASSGLFSAKAEDKSVATVANSLFSVKVENKTTTANSLFSAKTEVKSETNSLFSSKIENKPATSDIFSANPSSTKTTGNSLFGFSSKPDFSANTKPQNSLFGPAPVSTNIKKQPGSETSDLFSLNSQKRTSQTLPDDPIKKKAMLFLNNFESDVTFKIEDQEFPAHKSILSEKCIFFKNMFSSGMSESHASVIEITDTKAAMFKAFLQYVYLGKATLNEELAMGLFEFSEKYMIDELKESCENCLAYWITVKNCSKIYETACFYEAESLKKKALLFFEAHIKEITESKDFENLPKSTYVFLKRIQWNDKMIFDPSLAQLMNDYRLSNSESNGRPFLNDHSFISIKLK